MNERFFIRFLQKGKLLAVNSATARDGLMFANETDALPRAVMLEFDGKSPVTQYRMERIRHNKGWRNWEFKLDRVVNAGRLGFTGVDPEALPSGRYWFRIYVDDLDVPHRRFPFTIKENEEPVIDVEVEEDPRHVQLKGDMSTFDAHIRRILQDPRSRLEGMDLPTWLEDHTRRANRQACLLNLLAKLRTAPSETDSLIQSVEYIFLANSDRIYAAVKPTFYAQLRDLASLKTQPFYDEHEPKAEIHYELLERIKPFESDAAKFKLNSFRQEGAPSLQVVVAIPPVPSIPERMHYIDLDIDLGNPLQDVVGFFIHLGELIGPGRTDHLALRKKLKGVIAKYLYYDVV